MKPTIFFLLLIVLSVNSVPAQNISEFTSVSPNSQTPDFVFPDSHAFQKIIETGDPLTVGGTMPINNDFTGYVPIGGSSDNGYLSINKENTSGGVTILDINLNYTAGLWETTYSEAVDFSGIAGTSRNCSGTVTPWNTIISSEEATSTTDSNGDGYNDLGWNVEIDPETKMVINKVWAMGNFKHENIVVHSNRRTAYQGADSNPGYLYKFVADASQNLHSGSLYVYTGSKNGPGNWILLNNSNPAERNSTLSQSLAVGATSFIGIEDVEIGPDGMVYFAVKGEGKVYRFQDSDPISGTTATMETFVGGMSYPITHSGGTTSTNWGSGNDNLAFDNMGNLWVQQDGGNDYIWVVESGHTQASPKVKLFGIAPTGSEPTGITFTPDFKYLFMSIQHPTSSNNANHLDAAGTSINFDKSISLVIALNGNLGSTLSLPEHEISEFKIFPNPLNADEPLNIIGENIQSIELHSIDGRKVLEKKYNQLSTISLDVSAISSGIYILKIDNSKTIKLLIN